MSTQGRLSGQKLEGISSEHKCRSESWPEEFAVTKESAIFRLEASTSTNYLSNLILP